MRYTTSLACHSCRNRTSVLFRVAKTELSGLQKVTVNVIVINLDIIT